ncbi:MAG: hypothetical protein NTW15_08450 [Burkholderiales bacterium]|nr:hypothetical protein [Burkholderiales bacterium]
MAALDTLEWVLRSRFGFDKPAFIELLAKLLSTTELAFAAGRAPLWTFDRTAARCVGARAVPA